MIVITRVVNYCQVFEACMSVYSLKKHLPDYFMASEIIWWDLQMVVIEQYWQLSLSHCVVNWFNVECFWGSPDFKRSMRNLDCHWWTFPSVLKIPRWSLDQSMSNPQLSLRVRSYTDKESVLSTFDPDYTFWRKWCTKVALKKPLLLCNLVHHCSHKVDKTKNMKKDAFLL